MTCWPRWPRTRTRCTSASFTARYVDDVGAVDPAGRLAGRRRPHVALRRLRPGSRPRGGAGRLPGRAGRHGRHHLVRRGRPALAALAERPGGGPPIHRHVGARDGLGRGGPGRRPWPQAAVPVVRDVLPQWHGKLVVEVPGSRGRRWTPPWAPTRAATPASRPSRRPVDGTVTPDAAGARLRQPGRLRRPRADRCARS